MRQGGGDINVDALVDAIDNGEECDNGDVRIWGDGAVVDSVCRWGISEWRGEDK